MMSRLLFIEKKPRSGLERIGETCKNPGVARFRFNRSCQPFGLNIPERLILFVGILPIPVKSSPRLSYRALRPLSLHRKNHLLSPYGVAKRLFQILLASEIFSITFTAP
jgi:hypothetical protein